MIGLTCLLVFASPAILPASPVESARGVSEAASRLDVAFPRSVTDALFTADNSKVVWDAVKPYTLLEVELNPEMRVKVSPGPAKAELIAGQPQAFFVRVDNACGATARLALSATDLAAVEAGPPDWLEMEIVDEEGCSNRLTGAPVEYKLVLCTVKQTGRREVRLGLDAGQGTQDLGFRGVADVLFQVRERKP